MPLQTSCPHCHTRQTVDDTLAGRKVRCLHCEQLFVVRGKPDRKAGPAAPAPQAGKKARRRLAVRASIAGGLLLMACVILYLLTPSEVDSKLNALKASAPPARAQALAWLAEADPQGAARARVTAALEPLLLEGDSPRASTPTSCSAPTCTGPTRGTSPP
jgi:predicted Zn finger-like uncharacterized protein